MKTNNRFTKYVFPTSITSNITHKLNHARDSWEMIGQLMEKLNKNKKHEIKKDTQDENERKNTDRIAENISNMKHNFSSKLENHFEFYYWSQFIITSYLHILYSIIIIIGQLAVPLAMAAGVVLFVVINTTLYQESFYTDRDRTTKRGMSCGIRCARNRLRRPQLDLSYSPILVL